MKVMLSKVLFCVVILLTVTFTCFAERQLERAEILQIFGQLTQNPSKTWIPAGSIEATQQEYKAPKTTQESQITDRISQKINEYQSDESKLERTEYLQKMKFDAIPFNERYKLANESTMTTKHKVEFDGEKFYWEIDVVSRTDSVKPDKELAGNYMTDQFHPFNNKRIFAWDGEKYTIYSPLADHSFVDTANKIPHGVSGPLKAGYIPWGYGYYSYDRLTAADSSAVEKLINGKLQIELSVITQDISFIFILDPSQDHSVVSSKIAGRGNVMVNEYSNYQLVSGRWVPMTISSVKYKEGTNEIVTSDLWNITFVDASTPTAEKFDVQYEEDTTIEFASSMTEKPIVYSHSNYIDTSAVLSERILFTLNDGIAKNCATAALKYTMKKLGKTVEYSELASIISEPNNSATLSGMKAYATQKGLQCRAIRADIKTLKELDNYQIILFLPSNNHFVVLESIDNENVRIIDLSSRKFYYSTDISFFDADWSAGAALLLSNGTSNGQFIEISETELQNIKGAAGYSCTRVLQEENFIFCEYVGGMCEGLYTIFWDRVGCESAESGTCSSSWFWRKSESYCIEDPYDPFSCALTEVWKHYWMSACM